MCSTIIYACNFIISYFILYLIKIDLKKFKLELYVQISNKIWLKLYLMILIGLTHLTWLFLILFFNYEDTNIIYGFTPYLLIPYVLYLIIDLKTTNEDNKIVSYKLNYYLNKIMTLYFIFFILFILLSTQIKKIMDKVNKYILLHNRSLK